jgi:hypothetical protein
MPSILLENATVNSVKQALIGLGCFEADQSQADRVRWTGDESGNIGIAISSSSANALDGSTSLTQFAINKETLSLDGTSTHVLDYRFVQNGIILGLRRSSSNQAYVSAFVNHENNFPVIFGYTQELYTPRIWSVMRHASIGSTQWGGGMVLDNGGIINGDIQLCKPYLESQFHDGFYIASPCPAISADQIVTATINGTDYVFWNHTNGNTNRGCVAFEDTAE